MGRKKKRSVPVAPPKQEKKMVIDMNAMNLKKEHVVPGFRTGGHMTTKDRPRKKDWKREYERGKEPGRYLDGIGSGFLLLFCIINTNNTFHIRNTVAYNKNEKRIHQNTSYERSLRKP